MSDEILLYSNLKETKVVESALSNFKIKKFKINEYKKNHKNKNLLFFLNDLILIDSLKKSSLNNSILCLVNNKNIKENYEGQNIFISPISITALKEYAAKIFKKNTFEFSDINIVDKKIININNKKFTYFTELENKIFTELVKNKKLKKSHLKENILNLKSDINTYSIESHFSRIRKKLLFLESSINITSRGENFFIK